MGKTFAVEGKQTCSQLNNKSMAVPTQSSQPDIIMDEVSLAYINNAYLLISGCGSTLVYTHQCTWLRAAL